MDVVSDKRSGAKERSKRTFVTVYLAGGTFYLSEPLVFTDVDSGTADAPIVYTAMPGQSPIISGGQRLEPIWKPYRDGIVKTDIPKGLTFDQLFVDGQRQHMARWPDYDPQAKYFQGFSADATSPQRVARWAVPAGGFVHAMHRSLWGDMHWRITGKTAGGELEMVGGWQNNRQMGAHKSYRFVENVLEELNAPGEWYLDRAHSVLYFFPSDGIDLSRATTPQPECAKPTRARALTTTLFTNRAPNPARWRGCPSLAAMSTQ